MCFFKKKKKASEESDATIVGRLLGNVLYNHRRTEKAPVTLGTYKKNGAPCAFIKTLGPTLQADLGDDGGVNLTYLEKEETLVLTLGFDYVEGSAEIEIIQECLDSIDLDAEETLPGDVTHIHTVYCEDEAGAPLDTEIEFKAEGVARADLEFAARSLVDHIFDWLDTVYEAFEEEFGEGDFDEDGE